MSSSSLKIPDWATHIAINHDGAIYAFGGMPGIFEIPDGRSEHGTVLLWEPESEDDDFQMIGKTHPDMFWEESMQEVNCGKRDK